MFLKLTATKKNFMAANFIKLEFNDRKLKNLLTKLKDKKFFCKIIKSYTI